MENSILKNSSILELFQTPATFETILKLLFLFFSLNVYLINLFLLLLKTALKSKECYSLLFFRLLNLSGFLNPYTLYLQVELHELNFLEREVL